MTWASDRVRLPLSAGVLVVALLVMGACGDDAGNGGTGSDDAATDDASEQASEVITVPTSDWRPGDPGGRALLQGRLDMSDPRCPRVVRGGRAPGTIVVWPAGTYAAEASGTYGLYAQDGTPLAVDGDRLALGGSATTGVDPGCGDRGDEVFLVEADVETADA